jgi:ABC-type uncharacterized transport system permease subunit
MINALRPIIIFYKAQYKLQSKEKIGFLLSMTTPLLYSGVFTYQIIVNFSIKPNPFINLPIWEYFVVFFALQMVHFIAFDQSLRHLANEILRGEYDYHLLRPVNLWYFKYTRAPSLMGLVQTWLYFIALCISIHFAQLAIQQIVIVFLFTYTSAFIFINVKATLRGLVFFKRDILSTTMLEESIVSFAINKPPEIFPTIILAIGTAIFPIFVIHNNLFDAIRGINLFWITGWMIWWAILALTLNKYVWYAGNKKYESG